MQLRQHLNGDYIPLLAVASKGYYFKIFPLADDSSPYSAIKITAGVAQVKKFCLNGKKRGIYFTPILKRGI